MSLEEHLYENLLEYMRRIGFHHPDENMEAAKRKIDFENVVSLKTFKHLYDMAYHIVYACTVYNKDCSSIE